MEQEAKTTLRLQTTQKGKRILPQKCEEERKAYQERERQIVREIERDTLSRYGFIPDLGLSTFKMSTTLLATFHIHTTSPVLITWHFTTLPKTNLFRW